MSTQPSEPRQEPATEAGASALALRRAGIGPSALLALIGGGIWAALAFTRGVGVGEYLALAFGGALSLLLAQLLLDSVGVKSDDPKSARSELALPRLLVWSALSLLICAALGHWLKLNTHHRPLAAATYAVFSAGIALGVAAAALRFAGVMRKELTWAIASIAVLVCVAILVGGGQPGILAILDGVVGAALVGVCNRLRSKAQLAKITPSLASTLAVVLLAGCAFGVFTGWGQAAAEKAPAIAGFVGLLG